MPEDAAFCPNCGSPIRAMLERRFEKADWGERFIAWIIDMIVLGAVLNTFRGYTGWRIPLHLPMIIPFIDPGFDNFAYFLYWTVMEGVYGQSIGKMVMRLRVIRMNGERTDLPHAAVESIGKAFLLPIDCLIGWILYPQNKQRLFNHISETIVIKTHG